MIDLSREMDLASDHATPKRIMDAGLSWEACMAAGSIGLLRCETFKGGFFEPTESGRWCWVLPIFYGPPSPATLADLVAWLPGEPGGRWWRRTGNGMVLGFANVQRARASVWDFGRDVNDATTTPTLHLHATPKDYALADFCGAVVLDWRHGLTELDGIGRIICADLNIAERLERKLERCRPLPTILVETHTSAEAA